MLKRRRCCLISSITNNLVGSISFIKRIRFRRSNNQTTIHAVNINISNRQRGVTSIHSQNIAVNTGQAVDWFDIKLKDKWNGLDLFVKIKRVSSRGKLGG